MSEDTQSQYLTDQVKNLKASPTLAINELSKELIDNGRTVYKLGFGQSPFPVPPAVVQAAKEHAAEKDYLPVAGLPALRQKVAESKSKLLGVDISMDQVIIGPGSKELIFGLQLAFKCELLLPAPSWVSYEPQSEITGKPLRWIHCKFENKWKLTAEDLDKACEVNPEVRKLLILNYPSNPTGATYDETELKALAEVFRKHNVLVCSDEIYGETHFEGKHKSLAAYYPEGTIISGGLSKWCGAGGWRLGIFIFPKEYAFLQAAMLKVASETYSAVSCPIQYAGVVAYSNDSSILKYLESTRLALKWVSEYVYQELVKGQVKTHKAEGAFYLFIDCEHFREKLLKGDVNGSRSLCNKLLKDTGVALLPGADFGRGDTELSARLSFVDFNGGDAIKAIESNKYSEDTKLDFVKEVCPKVFEAIPLLTSWLKQDS